MWKYKQKTGTPSKGCEIIICSPDWESQGKWSIFEITDKFEKNNEAKFGRKVRKGQENSKLHDLMKCRISLGKINSCRIWQNYQICRLPKFWLKQIHEILGNTSEPRIQYPKGNEVFSEINDEIEFVKVEKFEFKSRKGQGNSE